MRPRGRDGLGQRRAAPPRPARYRATPRQYERIAATARSAPRALLRRQRARPVRAGAVVEPSSPQPARSAEHERRDKQLRGCHALQYRPGKRQSAGGKAAHGLPDPGYDGAHVGAGVSAGRVRRCACFVALCALHGARGRGTAGATPVFLTPVNISDAGPGRLRGSRRRGQHRHGAFRLDAQRRHQPPHPVPHARRRTATSARCRRSPPAGQNASDPDIAIDPSNNILLAWSRTDGTNIRIQSAFKPAAGSFAAPVTDLGRRVRRDQARDRLRQQRAGPADLAALRRDQPARAGHDAHRRRRRAPSRTRRPSRREGRTRSTPRPTPGRTSTQTP